MPKETRSTTEKEISNAVLLAAIQKSEDNMTKKLQVITDDLTHLTTKVINVETKQDCLQANHDTLKNVVMSMQEEINDLKNFKTDHMYQAKVAENKAVMAEYHSKKYNSILFNWPEEKAWENPNESRIQLNKFFKDVLGIDNPENIMIANCHRLGSLKDGENKTKSRPIIFRAVFWKDRDVIIEKSHKLLKVYNITNSTKYGVSQQLPKRMQENKNELLEMFKDARNRKLKAKWKIDYKNAIYYLSVDGCDILPK